jgi:hypothetical protein
MELEDMKATWAAYDRKLDLAVRLNKSALQAIALGPARTMLRGAVASVAFEAFGAFVAVVLIGAYLSTSFGRPHVLAAALVLDVYAIAILAATIGNLLIVTAIDFTAPVTAIQERLERFRLGRLRTIRAIFITAPLAWIPLSVVALAAFAGIDAERTFGLTYFAANATFGCAIIALAFLIAKRYPDVLANTRAGRYILQTLSGEAVRGASAALVAVVAFGSDRASGETDVIG